MRRSRAATGGAGGSGRGASLGEELPAGVGAAARVAQQGQRRRGVEDLLQPLALPLEGAEEGVVRADPLARAVVVERDGHAEALLGLGLVDVVVAGELPHAVVAVEEKVLEPVVLGVRQREGGPRDELDEDGGGGLASEERATLGLAAGGGRGGGCGAGCGMGCGPAGVCGGGGGLRGLKRRRACRAERGRGWEVGVGPRLDVQLVVQHREDGAVGAPDLLGADRVGHPPAPGLWLVVPLHDAHGAPVEGVLERHLDSRLGEEGAELAHRRERLLVGDRGVECHHRGRRHGRRPAQHIGWDEEHVPSSRGREVHASRGGEEADCELLRAVCGGTGRDTGQTSVERRAEVALCGRGGVWLGRDATFSSRCHGLVVIGWRATGLPLLAERRRRG